MVGNYPGVTVERHIGTLKVGDRSLELVDLPGTHALSAHSLEEQIAVDVILGHMVPTGTGFRDHYRTRVKKNIDFGEIGKNVGYQPGTPGSFDAEMEALLSGDVNPLAGDSPAAPLAPTGTAGGTEAAQAAESGALEKEWARQMTKRRSV